MLVTLAQHLRDKVPYIRNSERWLSTKSSRNQCRGMINSKDRKLGMGLLGEQKVAGRTKPHCWEKIRVFLSSSLLFYLKRTFFILWHIFLLKNRRKAALPNIHGNPSSKKPQEYNLIFTGSPLQAREQWQPGRTHRTTIPLRA